MPPPAESGENQRRAGFPSGAGLSAAERRPDLADAADRLEIERVAEHERDLADALVGEGPQVGRHRIG